MKIRRAETKDHGRIMEIYAAAQEYMIRSGNPDQWKRVYPSPELIASDIENGVCYVIFDDTGVHGVFAMIEGDDPTYARIENGSWLNDGPYAAIHRVASDGVLHGIVGCAADYGKSLYDNIRIDTHEKNLTMQRRLEKSGFRKCGIIYVADGSPRIAYQWSRD